MYRQEDNLLWKKQDMQISISNCKNNDLGVKALL